MLRCTVQLPRPAHGVVVRPRPGGDSGATQALILLGNQQSRQFRQIEGGHGGEAFTLASALTLFDGAAPGKTYEVKHACCPVYDPVTDCIYFAEGNAIMRLDSSNTVSLAAGSKDQWGADDGAGDSARFWDIRALAADGAGSIYIAEPRSIRKLALFVGGASNESLSRATSTGSCDSSSPPASCACGGSLESAAPAAAAGSCTVTTLPRSAPLEKSWVAIAYDPAGGELLAATDRAICRVPTTQLTLVASSGESAPPDSASAAVAPPELIAGDWSTWSNHDDVGAAARFHTIFGLLPDANRRIYVADSDNLRVMDQKRSVSTLLAKALPAFPNGAPYMAILPSGCLAVCGSDNDLKLHLIGAGFTPAITLPPPARTRLSQHLLLPPPSGDDAHSGSGYESSGDSGSNSSSSSRGSTCSGSGSAAVLTVRVGRKAFVAHRSLLSERSEYFKQLLEGGFAESGAAETSLPDADPDAFALLLEYMYTGTLAVPSALLRPTAELAGRLLMPGVCRQLMQQLVTECKVSTVVHDLLWAERHAMAELLPDLIGYFVQNRREVSALAPETVSQLVGSCPGLAAELILALSTA